MAARQFREQGYAAVSLRGIAAAAGLRAASLYNHFASKEDLVVAVLDDGIAAVLHAVDAAVADLPADVPFRTRLQAAVTAHLRSLLDRSDYTSANVRIFGQLPAAVRERNKAVRARYEGWWDEFLEAAQRRGDLRAEVDPALARLWLLGALNASLEWFRPERGPLEAVAESYTDLLCRGIEP